MTVEGSSPAYLLGRFMLALDRAADRLLQTEVGISYKRALFLTVLQHSGTVIQHELAIALGYSDPAVSTMLVELAKDGYVQTAPSATHGRKRLVTITPKGTEAVARSRRVLDAHFDQLLAIADVDTEQIRDLADRLHRALTTKLMKDQA
jgi:DNA-binding MarR family transcriptional regulator